MEAPSENLGGTKSPPPSTPVSERIKSVHVANVAQRPPGRPRKDGRPAGSVVAPAKKQADPSSAPAFPPGVIEKAVRSVCNTVDRIVTRRTYHGALALSKSKEFSEQLAGDIAMTEDEKEQIATLSEICCQQYGLAGQHTPAILLGTMTIGYTCRVGLVLSKLDEIAKINRVKPVEKTEDSTKAAA